jgi:hypothetical protein
MPDLHSGVCTSIVCRGLIDIIHPIFDLHHLVFELPGSGMHGYSE